MNRFDQPIRKWLSKQRPHNGEPIVSAHTGNNADLFADVARLYIPDGALVLDCTWGKGTFWKKVDTSRFYLFGSDVALPEGQAPQGATLIDGVDYWELRDSFAMMDVVVFDPPYKSGGMTSHVSMVERYGLKALTSNTKSGHGNVAAVEAEYMAGMQAAKQVLHPLKGGLLFVKCQDMVESGKQHWMHLFVKEEAHRLGFYARDLFALVSTRRPMMRHSGQIHSRKNISYLWVFERLPNA